MIMAGERLVLSLWDREHFQAEVGRIAVGEGVAAVHHLPQRRHRGRGRRRPGDRPRRRRRPRARRRGAGVGRLHRLLRGPRRVPLGDRHQPRTHRTEGAAMTDPKKTLRYPEVMAEEGLDDWRFFLMRLHARFRTGSFVKGLELVTRITEAAEAANHHPDVVLTYPQVDVDLSSHDVGGVTSRDLELARRISAIAAELGVEAAPREVSTLELALDVPDADEVRPFWATVLGYDQHDSEPEVCRQRRPQQHVVVPAGPGRHRRGPAALPPRHRGAARGRRGAGPGGASTPAAPWSAPTRCRRSGCSPTSTATRSASAPPRVARRPPSPHPLGEATGGCEPEGDHDGRGAPHRRRIRPLRQRRRGDRSHEGRTREAPFGRTSSGLECDTRRRRQRPSPRP